MLSAQLLQFSRDGTRLACAGSHAVTIAVIDRGRRIQIPERSAAAVAFFPDEVWTLDELRTTVHRFDPDGRVLGAPHTVPVAPCTQWLVPPTGAPAVLMDGCGRKALVNIGTSQLLEIEVPCLGVGIPLTSHRHAVCQNSVLYLGGGLQRRLGQGVVALGGAALANEELLLVMKNARGGCGEAVFSTRTGRILRQFDLPPGMSGTMRVAFDRGMLVVQTSERSFIVIDVHTGALHDLVTASAGVDDFAVDPAAERIAIRSGDLVRIYPLRQLSPSARPELELDVSGRPPRPRSEPAREVQPTTGSPSPAVGSSPYPGVRPEPEVRRIVLAPARDRATPSRPSSPEAARELERVAITAGAPLPGPITVERLHVLPSSSPTPGTWASPSSLQDPKTTCATFSPEPPTQPPTSPEATFTQRSTLAEVTRGVPLDPRSPRGANIAVTARPLEPSVVELFQLRGFGPPPKRLDVTRHEAARMLLDELRWIELRALLAIAHGWDTGRIAYANEGRHPQELEAAAILAGSAAGGHAQDHVEATRAALTDHERALASDLSRGTDSTPLGALATELELSPLATKIVLVIAGPTLRGELRRLYGILANDPTRAPVDELLVEQILTDTPEARSDVAHELRPNGPLCRYGLVHVDRNRPRPHAGLAVDPVVVARLRAEPFELGPGAATSVRTADRTLHEVLVPSELVLDAMRYLSQAPGDNHRVRIAVRGPDGSGRRTLLAAIAHKAGRDLAIIDLVRLPRGPDDFAPALRTELRRALLSGLVPCLTRLDEVATGSDDPLRRVVQDVVRSHPGPVAVHLAVRDKVPLDPDHLLLDLKPPTETQRLEVWCDALAAHGLSVDTPETLAARYRVGPGTIRRAVRAVADARAGQGRLAGDLLAHLEKHMRQSREARFGEQAKRVERLAEWSACVLPDDIEYSLRELVARVRHRRTVFDQWGFDRVITSARGVTALFEGLPGTGKTLVAGAIARELGLDLYRIDLSATMSKWIGETEKNIGAIFDAAEDGRVLLLFDEADSLFTKRTEVKSSVDRYANLEVNYLLQRLDAFEGFAILTTNLGTAIDPAFKRRLSFRLTFPFPDADARERLWRVHLPEHLPVDGRLDLRSLAGKYELSGGYIRNACLRAAFLAVQAGTSLSQAHLERAVELEFAEFGKLSHSGRMQ